MIEKMVKLRVKELRQRKGMSQTDLAKAMNVSAVAVGKWESGEYQPTTDKLPQLAMLLGVDISALFEVETPDRLPETLS
jgi:transcriptional regulator with XRE-family HTH domain